MLLQKQSRKKLMRVTENSKFYTRIEQRIIGRKLTTSCMHLELSRTSRRPYPRRNSNYPPHLSPAIPCVHACMQKKKKKLRIERTNDRVSYPLLRTPIYIHIDPHCKLLTSNHKLFLGYFFLDYSRSVSRSIAPWLLLLLRMLRHRGLPSSSLFSC